MNKINLNGSWKVFFDDGLRGGLYFQNTAPYNEKKWLNATVPGEIHDDLMKNGLIEDVYEKDGVLKARWVEENYWTYRKTFEIPQENMGKNAKLVLHKLDLVATIFLNGEKIGNHKNWFYPCEIDVSDKLKLGENILLIQLDSGLFDVCDKEVSPYFSATQTADVKLHKRMWQRKPQCQFGWDWSQRLINVGISGDVYLEFTEDFYLDEFCVMSSVADDLQSGEIEIRQYLSGVKAKQNIDFKVDFNGKTYNFSHIIDENTEYIKDIVEIDSPILWNPRGYGEQYLYEIKGEILGKDAKYKKIGFRKVVVNQNKHPENGNYFIYEVNNNKIFAKGANIVPEDMIFANITNERYDKLIAAAIDANFNFLRVWGGGIYESNYFYDLCDKYGILVWQEFIFACATYPLSDIEFKNSIINEVNYNIKRLASYPSLITWCGNNEQEWQTYDMFYGAQHPDYAIYHHLLPVALKKYDPYKYYQPSSPFSPDDNLPNLDTMGDQHPWGVGIGNSNFYDFREYECRFPNEGGLLGPTSLINQKRCLRENMEYMHSFDYYIHDNILENFDHSPSTSPDEIVKIYVGIEPEHMSIEDYTFMGGLLQGEGLKEYIENFRRRMFNVSSAIFWMFNDCWPATRSWTIIDYSLCKTPAFYSVKRSFEDINLIFAINGENYELYAVNNTLQAIEKNVQWGIVTLDGEYIKTVEKSYVFPENSSVLIEAIPLSDVNPYTQTIYAYFDHKVARIFPKKFCEMSFANPIFTVEKGENGYFITADKFAWGVCLGINGDEDFSDNFFDLLPNKTKFIKTKNDKLEVLYCGNKYLN